MKVRVDLGENIVEFVGPAIRAKITKLDIMEYAKNVQDVISVVNEPNSRYLRFESPNRKLIAEIEFESELSKTYVIGGFNVSKRDLGKELFEAIFKALCRVYSEIS